MSYVHFTKEPVVDGEMVQRLLSSVLLEDVPSTNSFPPCPLETPRRVTPEESSVTPHVSPPTMGSDTPWAPHRSHRAQTPPLSATTSALVGPGVVIPYAAMRDVSHEAPTPRVSKVFLGGLLYGMTRDDVARLATHFSGSTVSPDNVIVFSRGPENLSSGSAVVHMRSASAAASLMVYHKRILCEEHGARVVANAEELQAYTEAVNARSVNHRKRGPHTLVIEPARPRPPRRPSSPPPVVMQQPTPMYGATPYYAAYPPTMCYISIPMMTTPSDLMMAPRTPYSQ